MCSHAVLRARYMYVGSALYVWQVVKLRVPMHLGSRAVLWSFFNATWPLFIWTVSLACLLDETPEWLLNMLRHAEHLLPSALHSQLFIDPPALYPVCRLLHSVLQHEEQRLETMRQHANRASDSSGTARRAKGGWKMTHREVTLSDADVATIIERRVERLLELQFELDRLAQSQRAVPTAQIAPYLHTLDVEASMLEKVLVVDTSQGDAIWLVWFFARVLSEHRHLSAELDAVRTLRRRIAAVKNLRATRAQREETEKTSSRSKGKVPPRLQSFDSE